MLPAELLLLISSFLRTEDKCSFALVCRAFAFNVCWSDEELTRQLLARCLSDKGIAGISAPQRIFDSALRRAAQEDFRLGMVLLRHGKANPATFREIEDWLLGDVDNVPDLETLLDDCRLWFLKGVASVVDGGRLKILQHVLEDGRLDPAAENNLALLRAVHNGDADLVRALMASRRVQVTPEIAAAASARGCPSILVHLSLPLPRTFAGWPVPLRT